MSKTVSVRVSIVFNPSGVAFEQPGNKITVFEDSVIVNGLKYNLLEGHNTLLVEDDKNDLTQSIVTLCSSCDV